MSILGELKAIRQLTEPERAIILGCLSSKLHEWKDSTPLSPEEEDHYIDMSVLYHTILAYPLSIDVPNEGAPFFPSPED